MTFIKQAKSTESWSTTEMETVNSCPFCSSSSKELIFDTVQDWAFKAVKGTWQYWECLDCKSLYLNPRPKEAFIGRAYSNYYTHEKSQSLKNRIKLRLKNAILSNKYGIEMAPNLPQPFITKPFYKSLQQYIYEPYGIAFLSNSKKKGTFLDIGCGSGAMLSIAQQFGWKAVGLELDEHAVKTASKKNLNVIAGGYKKLKEIQDRFDVISCSHVIEHVYNPKDLLNIIKDSLNPGGTLLLSLPNANSYLKDKYQSAWRGLEAPRHIIIPNTNYLANYLKSIGFDVQVDLDTTPYTESISRRIAKTNNIPINTNSSITSTDVSTENQDFILITAKKN